MGDFMRQQFDKILVCALLLLSGFFLLHLIHHTTDQANTNQAWGVIQFFLGLLGGLVTGRAISKPENQISQTTSTTVTEKSTDPPPPLPSPTSTATMAPIRTTPNRGA